MADPGHRTRDKEEAVVTLAYVKKDVSSNSSPKEKTAENGDSQDYYQPHASRLSRLGVTNSEEKPYSDVSIVMTEAGQTASGDVSKQTRDVSAPVVVVSNASDATSAESKPPVVDHTAVSITVQDKSSKEDHAAATTTPGSPGQRNHYKCCPCSRAVVCTVVGVMVLVYLLALGLGLGLGLADHQSSEEEGEGAVAGVAADHTACSEVGRDILIKGGSAVDSAIATLLCVGVRQPHSMGIGGGLFLVVYNKQTGRVDTYDGREVAPLATTSQTSLNKTFPFGKWSIGVPGEVPAYWRAHQDHGRLPWKDLFAPAIDMADNGHPLSYSSARALIWNKDNFGITLSDHPHLCKIFCKNGTGEPKEEGEWIRMPTLANTLRGLAAQGPDYLYSNTSAAARALVEDVQNFGGLLTMEDLQNYRVVRAPPLSVSIGELTLHTLTAPSGGPVMALISRILHGLNLSPSDLDDSESAGATWHKVVEAFKFAYADRIHLADPAFANISQLLDKMASPEYARMLREAIDPTRTYGTDHYTNITGAPWREEGTTHISVVGPDGDAVSATSTINYYFGSILVSPSTGIILNNEMADFAESTPPNTSPNVIQPGKRPLSSMAPAVVVDKDGNPRLVLGSAGGARITNVNAQVMTRVLWLGQSLEDAIVAKRLHHQLFPNELKWEFGYPQDILEELASHGHTLKERTTYMAVVQAVSRDPETGDVTAFSDPRKHAQARLVFPSDLKEV